MESWEPPHQDTKTANLVNFPLCSRSGRHRADLCAAGHPHPVTASWEQGTAGSRYGEVLRTQCGRETARPFLQLPRNSTRCPGPMSMCLKVHTSPTYRKFLLAEPKPPWPLSSPQHAKYLQAEHPPATHSEKRQHNVSTGRGGRGARPPSRRVLTPGSHGRPWCGARAGAARQERRAPGAVPAGQTLVERGARCSGAAGRAGECVPYLPGGSSLRRGRRPLRSVPARERPSRRAPPGSRPPAAGTASGSAPPAPLCPAARPLGVRWAAGRLGLRPASHARLRLASLPAAEGPAARPAPRRQ